MRLFIVGVSCVGKTAIGLKLSQLIGYHFFDLDDEIEAFFSMPIEESAFKIKRAIEGQDKNIRFKK